MYFAFDNPIYLWYLASLPLLAITHFLSLRTAREKSLQFANFQTLKRISGKKLLTKNIFVLILRLLVLCLLIFAAAGVKMWYLAPRATDNYVFAIDVSSSMTAKDIEPTRLEAATTYAKNFVQSLDIITEIGVVSFAGVTVVEQVMTDKKEDVLGVLDTIIDVQSGGTDLPGAIITSTNLLLSTPEEGRMLILLTDGSTTLGNYVEQSMDRAIEYAVKHHVVVNAVGIGSENSPLGYLPEYYNISATYGGDTLYRVTNATGGHFFEATDNESLVKAFDNLSLASTESLRYVRLDAGLLITAILLLFVEWGLINSKYRRIA